MPRKSKFDEEKQAEIIRFLVAGHSQREAHLKYDYAQSAVNGLYRKAKAMVADYATNHSVEDTVSHFDKWDISEQWLADNEIACTPPEKELNESALVRNYQNGVSMDECAEIYDIGIDEVREVLDRNSVIIREDKASSKDIDNDELYKLPKFHTYDIVFVKKSHYGVDRINTDNNVCRPAIIITPQDYLNNNDANRKYANLTVIYGSTRVVADNKYNFVVEKYYTGKRSQYSVNSVDTIKYSDVVLPRNDSFSHLNDYDIERLKEKLYCYFLNAVYYHTNNIADNEIDIDVTEPVKQLFEHGFNRNEILDFLKSIELDVDKAEIQSILDRAGYGGIKALPPMPQELEALSVDEEQPVDLLQQIAVLEAKLSVYEKIFTKTNVSVNI